MDKRLNVTVKILLVFWMVFCIGYAILMYDEIPSALNAPERHYPFGKGDLGWSYASVENYVISSGILGTWFTLGGIISILAWKYPKYRIYVLFHCISIFMYIIWVNLKYS